MRKMTSYVGQRLKIYNGSGQTEIKNDHVEISKGTTEDSYSVIYRTDCSPAEGRWLNDKEGTGHIGDSGLNRDTAERVGRYLARKKGIVLLLSDILMNHSERPYARSLVLWHPEGFHPDFVN